ncbi:MAG: helix-turn-helix domain-containing protein [Myxococcaceae bacterium]
MRVRGSKTGRPVMKVLDLLGRRWSLRVLWELRDGPLTFRALRAACEDVSPTSLNERLAELRDLGAIEAGEAGYQLSASGRSLSKILLELHAWAEDHA